MCTFTCATTATATRQSAARTRANIVSSGSASTESGRRRPTVIGSTLRGRKSERISGAATRFSSDALFCPFCSTRWNQDGQDRRALDCRRDSCRVRVARFVLFFQYFMNLFASALWGVSVRFVCILRHSSPRASSPTPSLLQRRRPACSPLRSARTRRVTRVSTITIAATAMAPC
jgi:hypothetical protein